MYTVISVHRYRLALDFAYRGVVSVKRLAVGALATTAFLVGGSLSVQNRERDGISNFTFVSTSFARDLIETTGDDDEGSSQSASERKLVALMPLSAAKITGEESLPKKISDSDGRSMHDAFLSALSNINEERGKNRSNEFGCTQFFSEFYHSKDIETYIRYFRDQGIPASVVDQNREHFVSFVVPYEKLTALGYRKFSRDDRLVMVFTTASPSSPAITSFNARLFGRMYP
jgi:hypothetical protein